MGGVGKAGKIDLDRKTESGRNPEAGRSMLQYGPER